MELDELSRQGQTEARAFHAALTSLLFTLGKVVIGLYLGRTTIGSGYGAAGCRRPFSTTDVAGE